MEKKRMIDLTHPMSDKAQGITVKQTKFYDREGWNARDWTFYSHSGTHMDAPNHFGIDGPTIDQLPLDKLSGKAWVLDLTPLKERILYPRHLLPAQKQIPKGCKIILFRTDWYKKFTTPEFRVSIPCLSLDMAKWLIERDIQMIGVEPPSVANLDDMNALTEVHQTLFRAGIVIVEGLAYLDQINQPTVYFQALPLRLAGGDGSPCRAYAIEEYQT